MQDTLVSFPVRDVYLPSVGEVLWQLHGNDILQGRIVDYSDGGERGETFAVISVDGLRDLLIVPVEKLRNDCE